MYNLNIISKIKLLFGIMLIINILSILFYNKKTKHFRIQQNANYSDIYPNYMIWQTILYNESI